MTSFREDITRFPLCIEPAEDVDEFADKPDSVTIDILDRHSPLRERKWFVSSCCAKRWLSTDAVDLERQRRQLER